jgi:hypothetical protein
MWDASEYAAFSTRSLAWIITGELFKMSAATARIRGSTTAVQIRCIE